MLDLIGFQGPVSSCCRKREELAEADQFLEGLAQHFCLAQHLSAFLSAFNTDKMVTTRRAAASPVASPEKASPTKARGVTKKWAETSGAGDRAGLWAIGGAAGRAIHKGGTIIILGFFPFIAVYSE
jgi:hypothetical protein